MATQTTQKTYLDHLFPVIQHTAKPARLDEELKEKLNSFLPRASAALEKIIVENGGRKTQFRFFRAHHLAIALTPAKVAFCLDCTNATMFLGGLYCFELKSEATKGALTQLLSVHLDLNDPLILEAPRSYVNDPGSASDEDMRALVANWYRTEVEAVTMTTNAITLAPKVFSNTAVRVKPGYCFVLMPFSQELKEVYEDAIRVAIEASAMECKRADDIFHNSSIMEVIWTEICSAEIVISDLTHRNPNVFYELGIAHTLGKETIIITQDQNDVPFDLRHLRYIKYSMTGRGLRDLQEQLALTINSIRGRQDGISEH